MSEWWRWRGPGLLAPFRHPSAWQTPLASPRQAPPPQFLPRRPELLAHWLPDRTMTLTVPLRVTRPCTVAMPPPLMTIPSAIWTPYQTDGSQAPPRVRG